jgi:hypothetical protein
MNSDDEWKFIQKEVHGEMPTPGNRVKRELLFLMEILLVRNDCNYERAKNVYLDMIRR